MNTLTITPVVVGNRINIKATLDNVREQLEAMESALATDWDKIDEYFAEYFVRNPGKKSATTDELIRQLWVIGGDFTDAAHSVLKDRVPEYIASKPDLYQTAKKVGVRFLANHTAEELAKLESDRIAAVAKSATKGSATPSNPPPAGVLRPSRAPASV